jgi:hypothetical protein
MTTLALIGADPQTVEEVRACFPARVDERRSRDLLPVEEIAARLGVEPHVLHTWLREGALRGLRLGRTYYALLSRADTLLGRMARV